MKQSCCQNHENRECKCVRTHEELHPHPLVRSWRVILMNKVFHISDGCCAELNIY